MRPSQVVFASPPHRIIPTFTRLMSKSRNHSDPQFPIAPVFSQNGFATGSQATANSSAEKRLYRSVSKVTLTTLFGGKKSRNCSPVHSVHAGIVPNSLNCQRNNDSVTRYPSEDDLTSTIEVDSQHEFEATAEGIRSLWSQLQAGRF